MGGMYVIKVLLVDDEQYIREGLRQLVDWEEYGYEIIGEAGNGVDAIAILEESQVDVVFVDIRMPKMTGLELIEYVQEKLHRNIQFVILTGYADFEYARMAIRMHVKNYMLKPIQKEELSDILHKLNKEHQIMQVKEQEHYFFAVSAVVHGKYTEDDLETVYSHVVPSNQWKYVSIECMDADSQLKPEEQEIVSYLQAILKEFCGHGVPIMETEEEISGAALLLIPEMYQKNNQTEAEFLDALQRRMSHHFSQTFQVYAGSQENSLEDIRKSFRSVRVSRCLYGLSEDLYRLMEMVKEFDDETNQQEIFEYIGNESFHHLVMMGRPEEITDFFADYAGYFAQVRSQENRNILDKIDAYVKEHYMEKISLRSLGEMFYINNVYLGQLYKKRYHIVFRDYLNQLRLEKAKELLEDTDTRIYRIAEETGFGKADYFINKFVQVYGITPNQYRMKFKKSGRGN